VHIFARFALFLNTRTTNEHKRIARVRQGKAALPAIPSTNLIPFNGFRFGRSDCLVAGLCQDRSVSCRNKPAPLTEPETRFPASHHLILIIQVAKVCSFLQGGTNLVRAILNKKYRSICFMLSD
jgi:hypothetical protein